jgi:omega-6 fatty acid desaturase (delta-12 desaturase)
MEGQSNQYDVMLNHHSTVPVATSFCKKSMMHLASFLGIGTVCRQRRILEERQQRRPVSSQFLYTLYFSKKSTMKVYRLAVTSLATGVVVSAFQSASPRTNTVRSSATRRQAIAMDPPASSKSIFGGNKRTPEEKDASESMDMTGIALSGLNGQALQWTNDDFPEARELRAVIPQHCFEPDTATSLGYLSVSVVGTALCTAVGVSLLNVLPPENLLTLPFWALYGAVTGTVAMGLWVLAHECGHGAFSKNKTIQDTVGYCLHSLFLVPYYSWQRSHAVHHQYTNHMELGETHVPEPMERDGGSLKLRNSFLNQFGSTLGMRLWGALQSFLHLIIGWPAYLLIGATGGADRGMTNHYWPDPLTTPRQPKKELFPGNWKEKVFKSDVGVAAVAASAIAWAVCNGLPQMMALYGGPLIVVNAWLVLYTWCV